MCLLLFDISVTVSSPSMSITRTLNGVKQLLVNRRVILFSSADKPYLQQRCSSSNGRYYIGIWETVELPHHFCKRQDWDQ